LWLSLANGYSSRFGKLIEAAAVSLPTEFVQLDWQFGNDASYFSRRITAEWDMRAMMVIVRLKISKFSFPAHA